jgi:hypothetical protein
VPQNVAAGILPPGPTTDISTLPDFHRSFPPGWKPGSTADRMPAATQSARIRCSFQSQKMLENNFSQAYNALCETGKTEYEKDRLNTGLSINS